MSKDKLLDTHCHVCRRQLMIMKRCTRCQAVLYCSQECQREDWPLHKQNCGVEKEPVKDSSVTKTFHNRGTGSIFDEESSEKGEPSTTVSHPPLVDFSKAASKGRTRPGKDETNEKYLHKNEFFTDIPKISDQDQTCEITIKCNKQRHKLTVQKTWTGEELFKYMSYKLSIPLENVKVIHKGKVLTVDTVMDTVQSKAVYQVIGEHAEPEDDVDQRDISVMMHQCGLDRNKAIQKLRQKGDLLDALLDQ